MHSGSRHAPLFDALNTVRRLVRAVAVTALFVAGPTAAQADQTIRTATLPDYMPFTDYAPEAERRSWVTVPPGETTPVFRGYSWAVVRAAFHAVDCTIRLRIVPWARALQELRAGKVDLLFPTGKSAKRQKYLAFSDKPVNAVDFHVYVRRDFSRKWTGLSTLDGLKIATLPSWNFGRTWNDHEGINEYTVQSIEQGFRLLRRGQIHGFAGYEIVWDRYLKKNGLASRFKKLPRFGGTREYVAALGSNPDAERLLTLFDRGKDRIKRNGTFARINKRW